MVKRLRSPIIYTGGKGLFVNNLLALIPPHITYVEVFGGGASLLFAKQPSKIEVYNDIDSNLVNFFRILRNPRTFKKFYNKIKLIPYSREEFEYCRDNYHKATNIIDKVVMWFVCNKQTFGGKPINKSWRYMIGKSINGRNIKTNSWLSTINNLHKQFNRLLNVQIEKDDFRKIIERYDSANTFFYCDPPYVHSTRCDKKLYPNEMTDKDHNDLCDILLKIKGKCILSGYSNSIYKRLEDAGWLVKRYKTVCHITGNTKTQMGINRDRIEVIWANTENFYKQLYL